MKKLSLLLLLFIAVTTVKSQENYIRISGEAGFVLNSERDKKMGLGGTVAWLTQDNLLSLNPNNYITLSVKGFNNPYGDGKLIGSVLNKESDAFNYIMPLAGFRITQSGIENGLFIEPRIGAVFGASYSGLAFAPLAGYAHKNFDFGIFCDMGFGSKNSAMLKKNFFTLGVSIGYNIGL